MLIANLSILAPESSARAGLAPNPTSFLPREQCSEVTQSLQTARQLTLPSTTLGLGVTASDPLNLFSQLKISEGSHFCQGKCRRLSPATLTCSPSLTFPPLRHHLQYHLTETSITQVPGTNSKWEMLQAQPSAFTSRCCLWGRDFGSREAEPQKALNKN